LPRDSSRTVVVSVGLGKGTYALEIWKDITFNFESTDVPDAVPTPVSV